MDTLAYLRVSDPRQAGADKVSLEGQRAAIEALAHALGRSILPGGWYVEPGVSGGTADRPAFQALLRYCADHTRPASAPGMVLVYRDDRWGRFEDAEEAAYWRVHLRRLGWHVRFAVNDDTDNPLARTLLRALGAAQATQERETIRTRARAGMRGAMAKGWWVNREPFGYRRVAVDKTTGGRRQLEPGQRSGGNEYLQLTPGPAAEVSLVREFFTRYATGETSIRALQALAEARTGRRWVHTTIRNLLRNPAYVGRLVGAHGEVVVEDAHPALVPLETWDGVQRLLARNQRETSPTHGYPLSGLVTCTVCGSAYIGGGGRKGPPEDPDRYRQYRDLGYARRCCPGKVGSFRAIDVEPFVVDAVASELEAADVPGRLTRIFDQLMRDAAGEVTDARAAAGSALERERQRLARLVGLLADGVVAEAEASRELTRIRARIAELERDRDRSRFADRRLEAFGRERDRIVALATDFRARAAELAPRALRELLRPWVAQATYDKRDRTFTLGIRLLPETELVGDLVRSAGR